uniref:Uncharacterized protein n=1 Tax=Panagrolaimus sp. PS1159 TaxID=55785 RepID=A0AC35FJ55_9BILA
MDTRLSASTNRSLTLPSISEPSTQPQQLRLNQIKIEHNDFEMTQGSSLKPPMAPGLNTTVLYSPLHIDSMTNSKSPTLQVQHDEPMEDPPERSVFCRVSLDFIAI